MLEEYRNEKVILGISGGPDSMALLEMAARAQVQVIGAHVNYHCRPTADRDEGLAKALCQQHGFPCFVLKAGIAQGNFQAWARKVRYDYFAALARQLQAKAIFVAHHEDDLLETYLLQKQRGNQPEWWGLREKSEWQGIPVVRPLLSFRKEQLLCFLDAERIAYGIDESNLTDHYERNRLRHAVVEKLNPAQRQALCQEIETRNKKNQQEQIRITAELKEPLTVDRLWAFPFPGRLLQAWIFEKTQLRMGKRRIQDVLRQLHSERNVEIDLDDCVKLSKMYGQLEIHSKTEVSYCYVLDKIELLKTPYFVIQNSGKGTEAVTLYEEDFPICIRNVQKSDAIVLRFGTKKVFRWFIDRKIPREARKSWPVVVNCHGEIVLVPQIGCDVKHYSQHPTCFVVK